MEPKLVKPPGQDAALERLKNRYGICSAFQSEFLGLDTLSRCKSRRSLTYTDVLDNSSSDPVMSLPTDSAATYSHNIRINSAKPLCDLFKKNVNCLDDDLDYFHDLSPLELEEELVEGDQNISITQTVKPLAKETPLDVTLLCDSVPCSEYFYDGYCSPSKYTDKSMSSNKMSDKHRKSSLPPHINRIYSELSLIHQKLQLNDISEQNKKMEVQAKKVQGRLENLQRKCDFVAVQKCKAISPSLHEMKITKQEKTSTSRINKVNGRVYEILIVLMEWISDHHLSKLMTSEDGEGDDQKQSCQFSTHKSYIQEKCVKLLPVIAEQLQWMPFVNLKLHLPVIKFIYWSIRQLDYGTQHATMTATMRRLGEELFKGVTKGIHDASPELLVATKPKTAVFFKSSNLSLRFLSTLIVLKTVTQVDYLAQAFDSLCLDLKIDEGKALFLEYQAVPVILSHLKITNKGLLSNVMDSLLQMTVESRFLQPFLEACSNILFFRTCSVLLRHPKLDLQILEKLSIILQKLSKIKSNKKFFELFTLHLMLQEIQRTANPEHIFLCINLNSTLFNLGLTKCNSLVTTASS
ncbi:coiled-coil domain-containing protein 138 isoform X5 [Sminthopsis crassicaudata]|uniref:coiled-coil domain-containing protein 138 isoform X5 n=1 Tax=Sminthopsis crassicaudata TaxID=9301 RepID=UPI003D68CEC6